MEVNTLKNRKAMNISVSEDIQVVYPEFVSAVLEARFVNTSYSAPLWGDQGVPS